MSAINDDGVLPIRLPMELVCLITKSLEETDCVALALSGAFHGFSRFYNAQRKANSILVSYKCYFLSRSSLWNTFLTQHTSNPSSITTFNVNNCYWLPAQLLCGAIMKMGNLEELCVKDTTLTFSNLALVLGACKKITKLDFSYREEKWEDIRGTLTAEKLDSITQGFKKLTGLKISTCFLDARDYLSDPWVLILRILSWCRDCVDLAVEVTYSGEDFERTKGGLHDFDLSPAEEEIEQMVEEELFQNMDWVVNLRSLVLIKLGSFTTLPENQIVVHSLLLNQFLKWVFSARRKPISLRRLWIQDFSSSVGVMNIGLTPLPMTTYVVDLEKRIRFQNHVDRRELSWFRDIDVVITLDERFNNLEHLAIIPVKKPLLSHPRSYLPNLKYARASCRRSDGCRQMLDEFLLAHKTLEHLHLEFFDDVDYIPSIANSVTKLPKLKVLFLEHHIMNQEMVQALVHICPNIEVLHWCHAGDDEVDIGVLSIIRFPHLTSLHVYGDFQLNDGAFLLPIIQKCPKLKSLHLSGTFDPSTFFPNFDLFLKSAVKLRDLRLGLNLKGNGAHLLTVFKSLQQFSPDLERLLLFDNDSPMDGVLLWKHPDDKMGSCLVDFVLKMKRLVALFLGFSNFETAQINDIRSMMKQKVAPVRPALWFHSDFDYPEITDQHVPFIHYHEMVAPRFYYPSAFQHTSE